MTSGRRAACVAALAATVLWAPPRAAAVDITGTWAVTASCVFTPGLAGTLVSAGDAFTSGVPCWAALGTPPASRGFRYRDGGLLLPDGVAKVRLVPGGDTKAKVVVAGKGGNLALPSPLDVTLPVTVQLQRASGACWETHHPTASINREDLLKAAGAP